MKYIDDEKIWWHLNDSNDDLYKLLLSPDTNKPYRRGDLIKQDPYKGKVFLQYRYDRLLKGNREYWGIKFARGVKSISLDKISKGYNIPTPSLVSFSGGRTSAFMLKKILEAYNYDLPDSIQVCFANTGKEMPETLDFVHEVEKRWNVDVHWLELDIATTRPIWRTKEVTYETASRHGEPFDMLLDKRNALPNPVMRLCTQELKVSVMRRYMKGLGIDEWYNVLGLRADESHRVVRATGKNCMDSWISICPLASQKVTNDDIVKYWRNNDFDLQLPLINNKTAAGNCDLCYLKGTKTIVNLIAEKPELADWWIEKENKFNYYFRKDRPQYSRLVEISKEDKHNLIDDDSYTCFCHD